MHSKPLLFERPQQYEYCTNNICQMEDAKVAVETGVDGVDLVIGTSQFLREHSHGKDMAYITKTAIEVIEYVKRYVRRRRGCDGMGTNQLAAKDLRSDSLLRTLSDPILSICCPYTRLLMPSAFTVLVSLTPSVVLPLDKSTTLSAH